MDKLTAQEQQLADYLLAEVRKVVREELDADKPVSAPVADPVAEPVADPAPVVATEAAPAPVAEPVPAPVAAPRLRWGQKKGK